MRSLTNGDSAQKRCKPDDRVPHGAQPLPSAVPWQRKGAGEATFRSQGRARRDGCGAVMLSLDFLTLSQLAESRSIYRPEQLDQRTVARAMRAVKQGVMHAARPAMTVFFDGVSFRSASHHHRVEAAFRSGAAHCEFWCHILPGSAREAIEFSRSN